MTNMTKKLDKTYYAAAEQKMRAVAADIEDYARQLHHAFDDLQRETLCKKFEEQYGIRLPEVSVSI